MNSTRKNYLELLGLGEEARGADGRKAWPPTLPPVLAAAAGSTDPSVNTPAAIATRASFASWFSLFLPRNHLRKFKKNKTNSRNSHCIELVSYLVEPWLLSPPWPCLQDMDTCRFPRGGKLVILGLNDDEIGFERKLLSIKATDIVNGVC